MFKQLVCRSYSLYSLASLSVRYKSSFGAVTNNFLLSFIFSNLRVMWGTRATDVEFSIFSPNIDTVHTNFIRAMLIHIFHAEQLEIIALFIIITGNNFRQSSRSRSRRPCLRS